MDSTQKQQPIGGNNSSAIIAFNIIQQGKRVGSFLTRARAVAFAKATTL